MQRLSGTDARLARCAAMCIVVGLHAVVVILIWKVRDVRYARTSATYVVWLRLDQPVAQPAVPAPLPREQSDVPLREPEPQQPAARAEQGSMQISPPRQIDWNAQAAYTARKTVEESTKEPYRNFGPRKPPPEAEPEPPSIFEPEEDAKGEIAEDVLGNPVVRLNKNCYQEIEKRSPMERMGTPLTKCLFRVGKRKARGDLFDHLKKERPLPERKESVKSELPERVEDDRSDLVDP